MIRSPFSMDESFSVHFSRKMPLAEMFFFQRVTTHVKAWEISVHEYKSCLARWTVSFRETGRGYVTKMFCFRPIGKSVSHSCSKLRWSNLF